MSVAPAPGDRLRLSFPGGSRVGERHPARTDDAPEGRAPDLPVVATPGFDAAAACSCELHTEAGPAGDILVLRVCGEIDMLTLPAVKCALTIATDQRPSDLVVDLAPGSGSARRSTSSISAWPAGAMPRGGLAGQVVAPSRLRTGCVRRGDPRRSSRGTRCQRRRARKVRRCPRLGRSLRVDVCATRRGLGRGGPGSAMVRLWRAARWSGQARCWGWSWQLGLSFVGGDGRSGRCRTCRWSPLPSTPPGTDTFRPLGIVVTGWTRSAHRR